MIRLVIIDFHTHIFPADVHERREEYLRRDPTFAEMYASPRAKVATAQDLLRSMDEAGVDVSVALGFAWREHELCVQHNDYLLESAAKSNGRIVPFFTVNMVDERAAGEIERVAGARAMGLGEIGLGELRAQSQGWDPAGPAGEGLAELAQRHGLILLFHVSEPAGHVYPGKAGGDLGAFYEFVSRHPAAPVVGAHFAGGLPFYTPMPEVAQAFGANLYVDTAAQPLLYERGVYGHLLRLIGAQRVLMGSDFPLIAQTRQIQEVRSGVADADALRLILGGNAQRLLGLERDDRAK